MTRFLLLALALAASGASAQDARSSDARDGPLRATSLDAVLRLAAPDTDVRLAPGTYAVGRLDAPLRLVADGGPVRLTGTAPAAQTAQPAAQAEPLVTALGAPFPNPFGRVATVPFTLAETSRVDLRVLDVLGREVAQLARGVLDAGTHGPTLAADGLANGLYVVRATFRPEDGGPAVVQTRRLTLAR